VYFYFLNITKKFLLQIVGDWTVIEVEEGLNIVKEALKIGGEEHDEYSSYSSNEWEKVDKDHKLCENIVENNIVITINTYYF